MVGNVKLNPKSVIFLQETRALFVRTVDISPNAAVSNWPGTENTIRQGSLFRVFIASAKLSMLTGFGETAL